MTALLETEFGLSQCIIKKLDGYDNLNYLVNYKSDKYIFKTYTYDPTLLDILIAENEVLNFLQTEASQQFPKPIPFASGELIKVIDINGKKSICRMLSFLEGTFLGDTTTSKPLMQSLGEFLAKLDLRLQGFNNHTYKGRQWECPACWLDRYDILWI